MSRRLNEDILQRTYEENEDKFNTPEFAKALERFNELRAELENAADTKLTHLKFDEVTDGREGQKAPGDAEFKEEGVIEREKREWLNIMEPFVEKEDTWLSAPWLVTEVSFINTKQQQQLLVTKGREFAFLWKKKYISCFFV